MCMERDLFNFSVGLRKCIVARSRWLADSKDTSKLDCGTRQENCNSGCIGGYDVVEDLFSWSSVDSSCVQGEESERTCSTPSNMREFSAIIVLLSC